MKVESYSFPGGYPLFYLVHSDSGSLYACPSCVNRNRVGKKAKVTALINWESELECECCNKPIESAYGE